MVFFAGIYLRTGFGIQMRECGSGHGLPATNSRPEAGVAAVEFLKLGCLSWRTCRLPCCEV